MQFFKEVMKCTYPEVIEEVSFIESNKNNEKTVPIQFLQSILDN